MTEIENTPAMRLSAADRNGTLAQVKRLAEGLAGGKWIRFQVHADLADLDEPSVVVAKVLEGKGNFGYNAGTSTYGDLVEMGVVDPTKVTRTALQNAASVASLLLTTEAAVVELAEDKPAAPAMPGGMGGMGGMDF